MNLDKDIHGIKSKRDDMLSMSSTIYEKYLENFEDIKIKKLNKIVDYCEQDDTSFYYENLTELDIEEAAIRLTLNYLYGRFGGDDTDIYLIKYIVVCHNLIEFNKNN